MGKLVSSTTDSGVTVITLNDPPVNAYSYEMMRDLDEAILAARFDSSVHVIVLTGAGDKYFCCGADIEMLTRADPTYKYYFCLHANETLRRLEETPKLSIAALNGHCVGGGLEVALACDLRIARRGRGKIGLPEVKLGVLPGTGGTQRLTHLLGKARALELMVEGENLEPTRALELGLVNALYDAASGEEFLAQVVEYARSFTPPGKAALAVGRIKRAVQAGADLPIDQGLALERELQAELFASEDAREGLAAYCEKRPPVFKAR
ncbi:MAG: enoyl-CoA hydratase/isomerase family protein [Sorangiineae bacterium]|nr:enoyl-CoA hydratase/isomerase family protein [Polyangiaceae bacterium]MEB2324429.1 enoyl-CoA hydratase/isomerase family protein [Sorangiineae bacterium]